MFNPFKSSNRPVVEPPRWPERHCDHKQWMRDKIAWYAYKKYDTAGLFSPYTGDYFPISIHTGSYFNDDRLQEYREIKAEYPQIVIQARLIGSSSSLARMVFRSRVGDSEDFID